MFKVVWECGEGQTDTQTSVSTIHFASSTIHAKWNENITKKTVYKYCLERPNYKHLPITN